MQKHNTEAPRFDAHGRFIIQDYAAARPFASFLPGIAGPMGIPMWAFYVNRGQAMTSFGVESKDCPIMEFQPANKAYRTTPYTGFRTFIKILHSARPQTYEPFSTWHRSPSTRRCMFIGMNELELEEMAPEHGIQTNVLYFTLPCESFAGLARQLTLRNTSDQPLRLELLDGLPAIAPYGVNNSGLKEIGRTLEAWMEVSNLACRIPFFHLRASAGDTAEVTTFQAAHFALSFFEHGADVRLLPALVDPCVVFGQNTALSAPDNFDRCSLAEISAQPQVTSGVTPCGFFGTPVTLSPSQSVTIHTIIGHASRVDKFLERHERLLGGTYIHHKRQEANELTRDLTEAIATHTSSPVFDAYCRQTFLDNVLRGGWPILLGDKERPFVYHIYSRKHGDPERDYNAFFLAAEYYSQGNGNYRDVNQNRRNDVLFNPRVGDFNVRCFMSLIQADGYNPLVVQGSRFTLLPKNQRAVLEQVVHPHQWETFLAQPFTPGQFLKHIEDHDVELRIPRHEFLTLALQNAQQSFEAIHGEGYWIDHWTYNLDLIDTYLAVYPDRKHNLLFGEPLLPFYDSPAVVLPRDRKYVLANGKPRQFGTVTIDAEKQALIASRRHHPHLMRVENGLGVVYRTTLFAKLVCLAINKFATLDPWGMGIEMEAGRPGWYDAMNGLPGLFGSSMPEAFELQRLLAFLLTAIREYRAPTDSADRSSDATRGLPVTRTGPVESNTFNLPSEVHTLLQRIVNQLETYNASTHPERDFIYWEAVTDAREDYRSSIRMGFEGSQQTISLRELSDHLSLFTQKVQAGIARALEINKGLPPTYFAYQVVEYEIIRDVEGNPQRDANQRPYIRARRFEPILLPLFLEGPVRALKIQPDQASARRLYEQVKSSPLFDRQLQMYKVNASLEDQPHDIGRARAFNPGWLENESIWLHMEYKYLLRVLQAGLYEEFFQDFKSALIPFQDPAIYGRSPLENASFIVSSAHPDPSLHGAGFVARLSGSTAEFLSIWNTMMAGKQPFFLRSGELCLALKPALPGWLFDRHGTIAYTFLGSCKVTYHNPRRRDTFMSDVQSERIILHIDDERCVELPGSTIGPPYAEMVRQGRIKRIDNFLSDEGTS